MKEDILDKYALNQLNSEEKQWIKNALAEDPNFQEELDLHQNMVHALIQKGTQEKINANLKATISQVDEALEQEGFFSKGIEKELIEGLQVDGEKNLLQTIRQVDENLAKEGFFKPRKKTTIVSFLRRFAAAASILFLLSLAWYYSNSATINYQQEYAAAFQQYDNTLSKAVQMELSEQGFGGNPDEEVLQKILIAMQAYEDKEYQQAAVLLQKFLETHPTNLYQDRIELYLGISYLESDSVEKAILKLQNSASKEGVNQPVAEWYLALAYLKTKQIEKSKTLLNKLQNSASIPYHKKATILLQQLD